MLLKNKIDFAVVFSVQNANPNGDPYIEGQPRVTSEGFGEMSDVSIKRKIRNRIQDFGESIFIQADNRKTDNFNSLKERFAENPEIAKLLKSKDGAAVTAKSCETWFDVRAFGAVFAFKNASGNISLGVRGPVTIQQACSLEEVEIVQLKITKSVNGQEVKKSESESGLSSDRMGSKSFVRKGVYVVYGSISAVLAEKTGFTDKDALLIQKALVSLFENDASSARPEGSMEIQHVIWWEHEDKNGSISTAKLHNSLRNSIELDGSFDENNLAFDNIKLSVIKGF